MVNSNLPPPSSRGEFEIAIICALAIEYDAVSLLIDRFWDEDGDKYGRAMGDPNTYTTGRMGSFDIVLVLLPEIGKVSAASAASSFRSSFPKITLALLVGTCGGVPYTKDNEEILLGDVVISKTVIQYDLGRQYSEEFLTKETLEDSLGRPRPNIRSILTVMETNHGRECLENRSAVLLEQLRSHACRKKMRKSVTYEYPGILKDRLFEPNYPHKHHILLPHRFCGNVPCDCSRTLSCDDLGCEDEHLVQRQRLNDQTQTLSVFIGCFGSGDTILRSGTYRDHLARRHGLLAFEMEGAAIWEEFPCIIVKGVSNYADGHWNSDSSWQQFAAATAAATARALIERYPKTDKPRPPLDVNEDHKKRSKEEDECLKDMHITDPSLDKKRIEDTNGGILRDSYIWILTNAEFIQWRDNPDSGLLWIKGDPGKGKTMLLCGLIDELQEGRVTMPYYFFCQASDSRLNSATKVLCSLVYSFACQDQRALSYVMEKYRHAGKELFYNANAWTALSQILTRILQNINLKNKVLIIDGLDECVTDLPLLLDFIAQASGSFDIKWIVSSRNWPDIAEKLNMSPNKLLLSLELNEQSISDAVQIYIKYKVDRLAALKKLDEQFRHAVESHLSANANGTFLWVALVYKELFKGGVKKRHLRDLMTAFPPELEPLYARMMAQVCESQDAQTCLELLAMISLTYRPISLAELASFVEILEESDDFDELRDIIATCGSFLALKDDVVYFIHQSAKDFLLNKQSHKIFTSGKARKHHDISSRSVKILSKTLHQDMYNLRHPVAIKKDTTHSPDPLAPLRYACLFWVDHLRDAGSESSEKSICQSSLRDEGEVHSFLKVHFLFWLEAFCLIDKLSEGIIAIMVLESLTLESMGLLHRFLRDAHRFVLSSRRAIEYTPLQIYSSALTFAPTSSIIRTTFERLHARWIKQKPNVQLEWDACLQILDGIGFDAGIVKFSPDGTKLATYSKGGGAIEIWDRITGACLGNFKRVSRNLATSLDFLLDGSQLLVVDGKSAEILNLNTGNGSIIFDILGYRYHYSRKSAILSLSGREVILSNEDWNDTGLQIWDLDTGMQLQKEDYYQDVGEPAVFQIDTIDAPNEGLITVIRNPITGFGIQIVSGYKPWRVVEVTFSSDGTQLALVWRKGPPSVYILDAADGKCVQKLMPSRCDGVGAFSPCGTQLALAVSSTVQIWDIKTGACLYTFSGHPEPVCSVAFSPDGTEIASAGGDFRIWDLALGASVHPEERDMDKYITSNPPGGEVISVTYSPDENRFALTVPYSEISASSTIEIWNPLTGIFLQQLQLDKPIKTAAFSPDNTQLAVGLHGGGIVIWDFSTSTWQRKLEASRAGRPTYKNEVRFSPDGTRLAQVCGSPVISSIEIWDIIYDTSIRILDASRGTIDACFSSDGRRLGSITWDGTAQIWDLITGACLQTLKFDEEMIHSRAHSLQFIADMLQNQNLINSIIPDFSIHFDLKWLLRRGEPFLWLPPEYRPSGVMLTYSGASVAIVASGKIFFFRFDPDKLDAEMASDRSSILSLEP
ncbi:WD40 repeat-like protein [Trichoderma evansii]